MNSFPPHLFELYFTFKGRLCHYLRLPFHTRGCSASGLYLIFCRRGCFSRVLPTSTRFRNIRGQSVPAGSRQDWENIQSWSRNVKMKRLFDSREDEMLLSNRETRPMEPQTERLVCVCACRTGVCVCYVCERSVKQRLGDRQPGKMQLSIMIKQVDSCKSGKMLISDKII